MKLFSILLVAVSVFAVSCERHEFDGPNGTKQLSESHAAGGHEAAGETHAVHGETPAAHGEEKAPHGETKGH